MVIMFCEEQSGHVNSYVKSAETGYTILMKSQNIVWVFDNEATPRQKIPICQKEMINISLKSGGTAEHIALDTYETVTVKW